MTDHPASGEPHERAYIPLIDNRLRCRACGELWPCPPVSGEPSHEHRFDLQLGVDGLGRIYGDYEGYVRSCKCGEDAPDFKEWKVRRVAYLEQRAVEIAREVEARSKEQADV